MTPELTSKIAEHNLVCIINRGGHRCLINSKTGEIFTAKRASEMLNISDSTAKMALDEMIPIDQDEFKESRKRKVLEEKAEYMARSTAFAKESMNNKSDVVVLVNSTWHVRDADGHYSSKTLNLMRPYIDSLFAKNSDYNFNTFMTQAMEYYTAKSVVVSLPRISGQPSGVHSDSRLLVETCYIFPEVAKTDDCPAFKEFVAKAFGPEQSPYVLAWMSRMLKSLNGSEILRGHAVFLVGEPGVCKSQFINICAILTGDRTAGDVSRLLIGEGNQFNNIRAEYCVLACDDKKPPTIQNYEEYVTRIKNFVTDLFCYIERKGIDSIMINPKCRLMIGVNEESEGFRLLPPKQHSIMGKVMIFHMEHPHMDLAKWGNLNDPTEDSESVFFQEMPAIRKYLLDYQTPPHIIDPDNTRFGILPYHSSKVNVDSVVMTISAPLQENLQAIKIKGCYAITFTSGCLYRYLETCKLLNSSGVKSVGQLPHSLKSIMKYNDKLKGDTTNSHLNQCVYTLIFGNDPTQPTLEMWKVLNTIDRVRHEHTGITVPEIFADYQTYAA